MYKVLKVFQIGARRYVAGDSFTPKDQTKEQLDLMIVNGLIEANSAPKAEPKTLKGGK